MRTRITQVLLMPGVTNEAHMPFVHDADILIDSGRIVYAGRREEAPAFEADETIDGVGTLAMPGLCNMHTHTPMTLLRSVGSDLPLEVWLGDVILPIERNLTDESVRAGSDLGILEMLKFGTTSFNDMYMHVDQEAQAVRDSGMRALLGHGIVDFDGGCADLRHNLDLVERWNHAADDRIRISFAPHSEGATTPRLLEKVREAAQAFHTPVHIHVSETQTDVKGSLERRGLTPPRYLEKLGLTKLPLLAAHCVWLSDDEIDLFADCGAVVLHNPISNLKLASGVAPIAKMLAHGCRVALGTDGVASNNNLNLWEEIKLMGMLQKGTLLDATAVSPAQVIASATSVGAKAMGYDDLGLLKPGYLADLILLRMDDVHMCPSIDLENNLVYAAQGSDVCLTMVGGKVLYRNGEYTTMDVKLVKERAKKQSDILLSRWEGKR